MEDIFKEADNTEGIIAHGEHHTMFKLRLQMMLLYSTKNQNKWKYI